jgi:hypothetical protein
MNDSQRISDEEEESNQEWREDEQVAVDDEGDSSPEPDNTCAKFWTFVFGCAAFWCNFACGICASVQLGRVDSGQPVEHDLMVANVVLFWVSVLCMFLATLAYFQIPPEQHSWASVRESLAFARAWLSRHQPAGYSGLVFSIDETLKQS